MNPAFLEQIRINKTNRIRDADQAARHKAAESEAEEFFETGRPVPAITGESILAKFQTRADAERNNTLETIPRITVRRMLTEKKLNEDFVFRVYLGHGENYIQAMRQVLSRTRKKAYKKRIRLDEFKMFVVGIRVLDDCDEVTLMRTTQMPEHLKSVYDDLIDAFKK